MTTRRLAKASAKKQKPVWNVVGTSPARIDGLVKTLGQTRYVDDLEASRYALVAYVVTSPYPHAKLQKVDVSQARLAPGVVTIVTAEDLIAPMQNQIGAVKPDQPLLAHSELRWLGDRVALIAATSRTAAEQAAKLIRIQAEPLPGVFDVELALKKNSPKVHVEGNLAAKMVVRKGEFSRVRKKADIVLENTFTTGWQEHAYLETNGILAEPEVDEGVVIHGSLQAPFYVQKTVARVLGVPHSKVRVVQTPTGGAFGGKEDYPNELAACAAVLARFSGKPVKLIYNRPEDMAWSTKRHATKIKHTLLAQRDGKLLGMKAEIFVDAGAYLGLSGIVAERANASAGGSYVIPHVEVDTYTVYTNNPFGGAFRGFGAPQVTFALESQMDELAKCLGRDPIDLRRQNALKKGSRTPVNDLLKSKPWVIESLDLVEKHSDWQRQRKSFDAHNANSPDVRKGIGVAAMTYGCCLHAGGQHLEGSGALVQVHPDASVSVSIGGTEIGQGAFTAMAQLAAEVLGVLVTSVRVANSDTLAVPDSGPTVASRTTLMSGNAVVDAARQIKERLIREATKLLKQTSSAIHFKQGWVWVKGKKSKLSLPELIQKCYMQKINLTASGWYAPARKNWDLQTGTGQAYSVYCDGAMVAEVSVDTITGMVTLDRMTAVHDVGQAVFRAGLEGQIQGGIVQGYGYATMENLVVKEGKILNPNFTDYLIPTSMDIPEIDIVLIEEPYENGPCGAKGIGEPSLIPVPAAIANAVNHALGKRIFSLPLTPERVKMELANI